ncbi:MAG: hypothetical protein ORN51_01790 [Akkermansiaceae bacterium]|nr:hypothetical protein [Akkermansiaceae bacterium]
MRFAILLVTAALLSSAWAREPVDLANGHSPNGSFSVRIKPPAEPDALAFLEVVNVATKEVVGSTDTGGYAHFPAVAEDTSTAVLWSPDSRHLALMTRGTKRSTSLRLYRVESTGLTEVPLPSSTDRAFELLKAKESYRCVFQRPLKWSGNDTLVVRASGDVENPAGTKIPIWYEVDVTFNIQEKRITNAKIIETKPKVG